MESNLAFIQIENYEINFKMQMERFFLEKKDSGITEFDKLQQEIKLMEQYITDINDKAGQTKDEQANYIYRKEVRRWSDLHMQKYKTLIFMPEYDEDNKLEREKLKMAQSRMHFSTAAYRNEVNKHLNRTVKEESKWKLSQLKEERDYCHKYFLALKNTADIRQKYEAMAMESPEKRLTNCFNEEVDKVLGNYSVKGYKEESDKIFQEILGQNTCEKNAYKTPALLEDYRRELTKLRTGEKSDVMPNPPGLWTSNFGPLPQRSRLRSCWTNNADTFYDELVKEKSDPPVAVVIPTCHKKEEPTRTVTPIAEIFKDQTHKVLESLTPSLPVKLLKAIEDDQDSGCHVNGQSTESQIASTNNPIVTQLKKTLLPNNGMDDVIEPQWNVTM